MAANRRHAQCKKTMKALTSDLFLLLTLSDVTTIPPIFPNENEWDDDK